MTDHKGYLIRTRRVGTALFLVFALFAGMVFDTNALAKSGPSVRTVGAGQTLDSMKTAFDYCYGYDDHKDDEFELSDMGAGGQHVVGKIDWTCASHTDDKVITDVKYVLGNYLLNKIEKLLDTSISSADFQIKADRSKYTTYSQYKVLRNSFWDVRDIYEYLNRTDFGVVAYIDGFLDRDKNQQLLLRYKDLVTLYDYARNALRKIYEAEKVVPTSNEDLGKFLDAIVDGVDGNGKSNSVKTAVKNYEDKYDKMVANELLYKCLVMDANGNVYSSNKEVNKYYLLNDFPMNLTLLTDYGFTVSDGSTQVLPARISLTYKAEYDQMLKKYEIEKSYKNLNYGTDYSTPIREVFERFEKSAVGSDDVAGLYVVYTKLCGSVSSGGMGSKGDADTFIRGLFNGGEILAMIKEYENLKAFLVSLDSLPDSPTASEDVTRAINTYNKYNNLTESEKKKLSSDDLEKLKKCMPVQSTIQNVKSLISAITYPKNETEYRNVFVPALNKAETAYNSLRTLYSGTGIETFIDNRAALTDKYKVYQSYTDRIFDVLSIENENVCAKLTTVIEPLRNELIKLNKEKTDVFNHLFSYSAFEERYKDASTALKLRQRVDALMMSPSSQDKTEITNVKNAVAALNKQAKAFFGTLYEQYLQALEYGTYTDDLNKANRVDTLISRIGTVTSASGDAIKAAMNEYNGLTDVQKSLVKTYPTLVAAQKAYAELSKDISFADVSNIKKGYVYTHSEIKPQPVVIVGDVTLVNGVHYNVSYSNNLNVGTGTVTITSIDGGGYKGTFTKTFLIVQDSLENCGVSGLKKKYKWTGKKIKPSFKVTVNGFTLNKGTDYSVSYSNNKKVGTAKITIKGKGNYKGTATRSFKIRKKKKK